MATVALLGTLDTKGLEYAFMRDRIQDAGCETILIDAGVMGQPLAEAGITRDDVAEAAGTTVAELAAAGDRGAAMAIMAKGAATVITGLHAGGRIHGVIGLGGSGGTSLVTHAMQALPIGVPKLMVSTVASGDTRPYVGAVDITMMYSVVDIAGINRVSERILGNAAGAIAGMALAFASSGESSVSEKPLIGATMFGVTTPAVTHAREVLEAAGYEVLVFHATGTGGRSMEAMVAGGFLAGVLDLTTTELADELAGGNFSAGPNRLEQAGSSGVPQVVSLGALDMVNFGPKDTVPSHYQNRLLYVHNPTITLMRTTPEESAELGRQIATKLSAAQGPVALFIPRKGVSLIATEGGVFHDPASDAALFDAILANVGPNVEVHDLDYAINDAEFSGAMANRLLEMLAG